MDDYFSQARTCNSVCNTITSHWPLTEEIHQELKLWLKSEDVVIMSTNIDLARNDHAAIGDLCEVLVLLHINNQYLNCSQLEDDFNVAYIKLNLKVVSYYVRLLKFLILKILISIV